MRYGTFIKSTAIYSFLGFLPLVSRFFLFPIYVKILTPHDYGVIGLCNTIIACLSILLALGLDSSLNRFFFKKEYQLKEGQGRLFTTTFILISISSLVFFFFSEFYGNSIFTAFFSDTSFSYSKYGKAILGLSYFNIVQAALLLYFRNNEKPFSFAFLSLFFMICNMVFEAYCILILKGNTEMILNYKLMGGAVGFGVSLIVYLSVFHLRFDSKLSRDLILYSIPICIYSIFGFIYNNADRFIVQSILSLADLGVYNTAITIATIIELFLIALDSALVPYFNRFFEDRTPQSFDRINQIFRGIGYLSIFLTAFLYLVTPYFILHFTRKEYFQILYFMPLIFSGLIFRYYLGVVNKPLFLLDKTKYLPYLNLITGIGNIILNYLLIPYWGLLGVALSMMLSKMFIAYLAYFFSVRKTIFVFKLGRVNIIAFGLIGFSFILVTLLRVFGLQLVFIYYFPIIFMLLLAIWNYKEIKTKILTLTHNR